MKEEEVTYLPPKYVYLNPIIEDSTVNKTSYILPVNQSQNSEYISSPQPNINQNQETVISEYISISQPNINQNQGPVISEYKSTSQPNINKNQETVISEYISTSQPKVNQNQETTIAEYISTSQPKINQNQNQGSIISEYNSTSQPKINQNQESIKSQYNGSPQRNLSENSNSVNIESIITRPLSNSRVINLPNINRSNISQSSHNSQQIRISNSSHPLDTEQPINQSIISQTKMTQSIIINKSNMQNSIASGSNNQQRSVPINSKSFIGKIPGVLPVYRLIKQGSGINPTEEQGIVFCAMKVFQEEILPLSNNTARFIQRKIGGDWLVIVYEQGKPVDFNMTCVEGIDYMYFTLDTIAFQVCRLR